MLLTLFDSKGQTKATFEPNDSSTQDKEIQGDNLLKLSFTLYECISVDVNDYLDYDGERYWATEKYTPAQKSTMEWEYSFQMRGIESLISRFLVLNNTGGENEAVFALTARPVDHMRLIVKNINEGMDGLQNFKTGVVEGTENVVIDYTGKYCQEALKELADAVHTEWWFDGQTLNLCRCEHGEEVTLGYGNGLTSLDRDLADNVKFYTRLFPVGSSRNIDPEKYHHSRLMLPGGVKYVDVNVEKYGIIHHYEQTAFADIYPRRTGTVSEVRHEEVKDKDGKPFTIYYFKDKDLPFNPNDYEIGGLVKRVSFQEGSELAGLGTDNDHYFEVNYDSKTQEFEIITIWPYDDGTQLPGGTLVPKPGDRYILWNLRMPDEYYGLAEQEFLAAVEKYNKEHALDVSRYKAPTDHVWMEDTGTDLFIGRRVRLESSEYFPGTGFRKSRITHISRQVNLPGRMDLEISDALSTGTMQKVDDSIKDVKNYTGSLVGALNVPDVIRSGDTTKPADTNIFSARRSQKEFLSKKEEDVAQQLITFLKGIGLGADGRFSVNADGVALLSRILVGNYVKGSSGAGIYADGQGNYHIDGGRGAADEVDAHQRQGHQLARQLHGFQGGEDKRRLAMLLHAGGRRGAQGEQHDGHGRLRLLRDVQPGQPAGQTLEPLLAPARLRTGCGLCRHLRQHGCRRLRKRKRRAAGGRRGVDARQQDRSRTPARHRPGGGRHRLAVLQDVRRHPLFLAAEAEDTDEPDGRFVVDGDGRARQRHADGGVHRIPEVAGQRRAGAGGQAAGDLVRRRRAVCHSGTCRRVDGRSDERDAPARHLLQPLVRRDGRRPCVLV